MKDPVPNNWQKVKLGGITLQVNRGFQPSYTEKDGVKVVNQKCIRNGRVNLKDTRLNNLKKKSISSDKYLKPLDILINSTGTGTVGRVGQILDIDEPLSFDSHVTLVRPDISKVDGRYLGYALWQLEKYLENLADGSTNQVELSRERVRNIELAIPQIKDQKKISSTLSSLDDKIEVNNKIAKNLEEMAQAIFKEWFINFRFPGYEKVEFVDSEFGKIPKGWEVKSLSRVTVNFDRKRRPLSSMERLDRKGMYPYYGATEIMDYIDEYIFDGEYLLIAEDGTVETNEGKAVLQFINGKFWVNNHAHIIQGADGIPTFYLYLLLKRISIKPYVTGAVQLKLTQENLNKIPVIVPDTNIMKKFSLLVYPMILKARKSREENQKLSAFRDLLLPKLMKGEIRV